MSAVYIGGAAFYVPTRVPPTRPVTAPPALSGGAAPTQRRDA